MAASQRITGIVTWAGLLALSIAAAPAHADPAAEAGPAPNTEKESAAEPVRPDPPASGAEALGTATPPAVPRAPSPLLFRPLELTEPGTGGGLGSRPVNLFPAEVFGPSTASGSNERKLGKRLDEDWKVQVAQIGGMVAGFAALSALCSGGACMLPRSWTSWIPGTLEPALPAPAYVGPQTQNLPKPSGGRR